MTVGEVARRAGVATSALRFYETEGLIHSERTPVGHRRYHADVLRRVSFIRTAQLVGLSLGEIREALSSLPDGRTPTARDWAQLARSWRPVLDQRIKLLTRMRNQLDSWDKVVARKSTENPLFKKVLDSQRAYAQRAGQWQNDYLVDFKMAWNHYFAKK